MKMTNPTVKLAFALSALILATPTALFAQDKDLKLVTCAELLAMDAEAQMKFTQALVAASADALDLNDLVAEGGTIGPMIQVCQGNPEMMAMDAAMSMKK